MYGCDTIKGHEPGYSVQRTRDAFNVVQMVPHPRAAVIMVIIPEYTPYFNEQFVVVDSVLAFRPTLIGVISAPGYFYRTAYLLKRIT